MHLRQPRFNETIDSQGMYQNQLENACFQHELAFEILNIYLKMQLLINYYMIKHLILLKIRNVMYVKVDLRQWFPTL